MKAFALHADKLMFMKEPQVCSLDDYEKAKTKLIDLFSSNNQVSSIYQIGGISHPGISDLDLIVVLQNGSSPAQLEFTSHLNERDKYVLMHSPFLANKSLFTKIGALFDLGKCQHVYGEQVTIAHERTEWKDFFDYLIALENVIDIAFVALRELGSGLIKIRSGLCRLNSLKCDLKLFDREDCRDEWSLIDEVGSLRENWFILPDRLRKEKLVEIYRQAPEIASNVLRKLERYGLKKNFFKPPNNSQRVRPVRIWFQEYLQFEEAPTAPRIDNTFWNHFITALPRKSKIFRKTSILRTRRVIPLRSGLAPLLSPNHSPKNGLDEALDYRMNLLREYLRFFAASKTGFSPLVSKIWYLRHT